MTAQIDQPLDQPLDQPFDQPVHQPLDRLRVLLGREPTSLELGRYRRRRARLLLRQHQALRLRTARLITRW